jgi:hypothetical protein
LGREFSKNESVGVQLRIGFHTPSYAMHPSAWKGYSAKLDFG